MALPTTELEIDNMALGRIGAKRITQAQLDADPITNVNAQHCDLHYDQTRDALQRSNWWRFARARIELVSAWATATVYTTDQYVSNDSVWYKCLLGHTSVTTTNEPPNSTYWTTLSASDYTPDEEWDYMWDLPGDFLRFRSIYEEDGTTSKSRRHAIEGQILLTNLSGINLLYIKQVTDVSLFDPLFTEVLVLCLALKLAPPIAGVGSVGQSLLKEIKDELYGRDGVMTRVRAVDDNETDVGGRSDWNLARYGGVGIASEEERFW